MTLPYSLAHCPTFTAYTLPRSSAFVRPSPWKASYARSKRMRCCGSIAAASAPEMLKKVCWKSSASCRNEP
eukprot:1532728-Prymnesium_polylepis.1